MNSTNWNEPHWYSWIRKIIEVPEDVPMFLSDGSKQGICVPVRTWPIWRSEPLKTKVRAFLKRRWLPPESKLQEAAREILLDEVFGSPQDLGPWLLQLTHWHQSQSWKLESLTDFDIQRADAMDATTVSTQIRYSRLNTTPQLNLHLADRSPFLMLLPFAMCIKIPVISFQYFLQINSRFAFNSIRSANHPFADDLISYLYEILFIQQKVAISLLNYLKLAAEVASEKQGNALMNGEIEAIIGADSVFPYLKASIEKTLIFTGLIFSITGLDSKTTHGKKLNKLKERIANTAGSTPYGALLLEFLEPENFGEINNFRTGILHKRGISDLQPHNYVGVDPKNLPFIRIYQILHEQHTKNTVALICSLALLTDNLASADLPAFSKEELFLQLERPMREVSLIVASAVQELSVEYTTSTE